MNPERSRLKQIVSRVLLAALGIVFLTYLVVRTSRGGNDINVYLHAATQLLQDENIYAYNPYNFYLYSPLFALLISPLTLFSMSVARVIWMLINLGLAVRLWILLYRMIERLSKRSRQLWSAGVIILSLGFLNHNFVLGQVTILILWLTIEGLYQVAKGHVLRGSILLALGINFKILPALALFYLGVKGEFKALALTLAALVLTLFIPAIFVGWQNNAELLVSWKGAINPAGERFAFEDNDGCQSLNAVLPAYFFDFDSIERTIEPYKRNVHFPRRIAHIPYDTLNTILQILRLMVLAVFFFAIAPRSWFVGDIRGVFVRFTGTIKKSFTSEPEVTEFRPVIFFWEVGLLSLVTLLIFPHQMKYSMLYFVPAGAYLLLCMLSGYRTQNRSLSKLLLILGVLLMIVFAVMGREIIGTHLVDVLDYYHFMGLGNFACLFILWYLRPLRTEIYKVV